jgi:hypothetical protein
MDAQPSRDSGIARDALAMDARPDASDGGPRPCKKAPPGITILGKVSGDVSFVAVDDSQAYWTDKGAGMVNAVPLAGGSTTVLATGQAGVDRIALDAAHVYFSTNDSVLRVLKDGSAPPVTLAQDPFPVGIAVDAARIYWTSYQFDGSIMTCSLAACMPEVLAANQAYPDTIVIDGVNAYWTNHAHSDRGQVVQMPLQGGPIVSLTTGQVYPLAVVADTASVYFSDSFSGPSATSSIVKAPIDGGSPEVTLQAQLTDPRFMAIDETRVYWADATDGTVMATPKGGGTAVTIASGQSGALSVAVDDCNVYWATTSVVAMTAK